jgi:hypothetical protein
VFNGLIERNKPIQQRRQEEQAAAAKGSGSETADK